MYIILEKNGGEQEKKVFRMSSNNCLPIQTNVNWIVYIGHQIVSESMLLILKQYKSLEFYLYVVSPLGLNYQIATIQQ